MVRYAASVAQLLVVLDVTCALNGAGLRDGVAVPTTARGAAALGPAHALGVLVSTAVSDDAIEAESLLSVYRVRINSD